MDEFQFQSIYFDPDKYNLRLDAIASLDENVTILQKFPDITIRIEGYADGASNNLEYELALAERRAMAAKDYLVRRGISVDRITILSTYNKQPKNVAHDDQTAAQNRRCDFVIIGWTGNEGSGGPSPSGGSSPVER